MEIINLQPKGHKTKETQNQRDTNLKWIKPQMVKWSNGQMDMFKWIYFIYNIYLFECQRFGVKYQGNNKFTAKGTQKEHE